MPKKFKKSKTVARRPRPSSNVYVSKCCGAQAKKNPLTMPRDNRIGRLGASPKDADQQGLHGWRCTKCGKACSCNRSKLDVKSKLDALAAQLA